MVTVFIRDLSRREIVYLKKTSKLEEDIRTKKTPHLLFGHVLVNISEINDHVEP